MQDLDEFKNEMNLSGKNVYVGHRYVPKIMGDWDNTKIYEPLSIVQYQGASYTSRQYVPSGIEITNEEYWSLTGNYNAQIEQYRQDVVNLGNDMNTLSKRLNKEYQNVSTQLVQTKGDMYKGDVYQSSNDIGYKAVYNEQGTIFVVTEKPNGNGYIRFRIKDNDFTTTESVGSPAELMRVFEVREAFDCFIMSNDVTSTSGDEWIDGSTNYVINDVVQSVKTQRTSVKTAGAWVEYTVTVPRGLQGVTALIYGTEASPTDSKISVDGTDVITNLDVTDQGGAWQQVYIPIDRPGTHTIRFTTVTSSFFTIGGLMVPLKEFVEGFSFNEILAFHGGPNPYVHSRGAMEYALFDSDLNLWCGSYHGGEVRNRLQYLLDGKETSITEGNYLIGKTFEIEQDTRIVDKINAYSIQTFKENGTIEHSVVFDGDINLTRLFTNMSTTSDAFTGVIYPQRLNLTTEGNYRLPAGINYIVQKNPITNQKAVTILNNNMYPADKKPDPYIKLVNGAYAKVYNDNISSDVPVNFTGGNFRTIHIFE